MTTYTRQPQTPSELKRASRLAHELHQAGKGKAAQALGDVIGAVRKGRLKFADLKAAIEIAEQAKGGN